LGTRRATADVYTSRDGVFKEIGKEWWMGTCVFEKKKRCVMME